MFKNQMKIVNQEAMNRLQVIALPISAVAKMERNKNRNALQVFIGYKVSTRVTGKSYLAAMLLNHGKAMENAMRVNILHGQEIVESIEDAFTRNIKNSHVRQALIGMTSLEFVIILPMLVVQEAEVHPQIKSE